MKFSNFNSRIELTDKTSLLYNALSNYFLLIKSEIKTNDIEFIEKNNLKLWKILNENGFIVDSSKDEIEEVKSLRDKVDLSQSSFYLILNPTLNCNFKCWYCYETHIKHSYMDDRILDRTKKFIRQTTAQFPVFTLGFFGGEPLLYYQKVVKPLIVFTKKCCEENQTHFSVTFTTNGYLINQEMVDFFKNSNVQSLQITLDGNEEEHNQTRYPATGIGSYQTIIENVKQLLENKIHVLLRINCTDKNIHSTKDIANDFEHITSEMKKYLKVCFKQVWQNAKDCDIDEEIIQMEDVFSSKGLKSGAFILNNLKSPCYGDKKNSLLINYNGDIYKCTAVDFVNTTREGYLSEDGSVIWENDSLNNRLNSKFQNPTCFNCRILPICNGGCSQKALAYKGQDYCILSFSEKKKNDAIIERFRYNILSKPNWGSEK